MYRKGRKARAFFPLKILDIHFIQLFFVFIFSLWPEEWSSIEKPGRRCPLPVRSGHMLFYSGIRMFSASEIPRSNKTHGSAQSQGTASSSRLRRTGSNPFFRLNNSSKKGSYISFICSCFPFIPRNAVPRRMPHQLGINVRWSDRERFDRAWV